MDFNKHEMDLVHSYWVDITQDPDYISQDTGIDKLKIIQILKHLSKNGEIQGLDMEDNSKVKTFFEMKGGWDLSSNLNKGPFKINVDDYHRLQLPQMKSSGDDKDYFYGYEMVDRSWSNYPFMIYVRDRFTAPRTSGREVDKIICFTIDIDWVNPIGKTEIFWARMFYDRTGLVYFSNHFQDPNTNKLIPFGDFVKRIGDKKQSLFNLTSRVLDELVPLDYWEVTDRMN